jgi:pimeloyl-ACP methyl ester carboxylesterase
MADVILVHGAMHGGWCWGPVEARLHAAGHRTVAPTLTGCGDRAHLLAREVGPHTHVEDVIASAFMEDVRNAVLVVHSYAGVLLGPVVERAGDRIAAVMAIGAFLVEPGEALADVEPDAVADRYRAIAERDGAGWRVPASTAFLNQWAVPADLRPWVGARLTDFPLRCVEEAVTFDPAPLARLPRHYVEHTDPPLTSLDASVERARATGWMLHTIPTGHDAMLTDPDETAALIDSLT